MQQRLALPLAAQQIAGFAVFLDLPNVAADRLPTLDLPGIFVRHAATHVVAAVPLEPAARIVGVDPAFAFPFRQRLTGIDAKEIEFAIARTARKLGALEPARGKFTAAIGH